MLRFFRDTDGLSHVEYGLILGLIASLAAVSVHRVMDSTRQVGDTIRVQLDRGGAESEQGRRR